MDVCVLLPGAINTSHFDRVRQKLGLQPRPVPPVYQPEAFAEVVLHCCEHPYRELPIGWGAQRTLWAQKLLPRLVDLWLRRTAGLATVLGLLGVGMPAAVARMAQSNGHAGPVRRLTRIG